MLVFIAHFSHSFRNKRFFVVGPGKGKASKKLFFLSLLPPPSTMHSCSHSVFLKRGRSFLGGPFVFSLPPKCCGKKFAGLGRKQLRKVDGKLLRVAILNAFSSNRHQGRPFFLSLLACTHAITRISEFMHVIFIERRRGEVKAFCRIKVARKKTIEKILKLSLLRYVVLENITFYFHTGGGELGRSLVTLELLTVVLHCV